MFKKPVLIQQCICKLILLIVSIVKKNGDGKLIIMIIVIINIVMLIFQQITNLQYSSDNKFILTTVGKPVEIVTWRLHNFKQDLNVNEAQYPELYKGTGKYIP